jgi:hypothetical protein
MLLIIACNSVYLALDDYNFENNSKVDMIRLKVETSFNILYLIELGLKIAGLGIVGYLKDLWNLLDFIVIIQIILEMTPSLESVLKLNSLRLLRVLRPLKSVRTIEGLKTLVESLF